MTVALSYDVRTGHIFSVGVRQIRCRIACIYTVNYICKFAYTFAYTFACIFAGKFRRKSAGKFICIIAYIIACIFVCIFACIYLYTFQAVNWRILANLSYQHMMKLARFVQSNVYTNTQ